MGKRGGWEFPDVGPGNWIWVTSRSSTEASNYFTTEPSQQHPQTRLFWALLSSIALLQWQCCCCHSWAGNIVVAFLHLTDFFTRYLFPLDHKVPLPSIQDHASYFMQWISEAHWGKWVERTQGTSLQKLIPTSFFLNMMLIGHGTCWVSLGFSAFAETAIVKYQRPRRLDDHAYPFTVLEARI